VLFRARFSSTDAVRPPDPAELRRAGDPAMIGRLDQAADLVRGTSGAVIEKEARSSRTL
jgi:hypothetical protein